MPRMNKKMNDVSLKFKQTYGDGNTETFLGDPIFEGKSFFSNQDQGPYAGFQIENFSSANE